MTDPHIAEMEARLDNGDTFDAMVRDGRIDLGLGVVVHVPTGAVVTHGKYAEHPHASMSMPTDMREGKVVNRSGFQVREHSDGTYSTMNGRPIVDSKESRKRHLERSGHVDWDG